jgi:hypothetical protein
MKTCRTHGSEAVFPIPMAGSAESRFREVGLRGIGGHWHGSRHPETQVQMRVQPQGPGVRGEGRGSGRGGRLMVVMLS